MHYYERIATRTVKTGFVVAAVVITGRDNRFRACAGYNEVREAEGLPQDGNQIRD